MRLTDAALELDFPLSFEKILAFLPLKFEGPESEAKGDDGYGLGFAADGPSFAAAYGGVSGLDHVTSRVFD